jgi:carbamate kinase
MSAREARAWLRSGQFGAGSMAPKVEAAIRFLEGGGESFDVTTPALALQALRGVAGTRIRRDP